MQKFVTYTERSSYSRRARAGIATYGLAMLADVSKQVCAVFVRHNALRLRMYS